MKRSKCEEPLLRVVYTNEVLKLLDNPDYYFKEGVATDEDIDRLRVYLTDKGLPVPNIPDTDQRDDVIKAMSRVWHSIELLNLTCALVGERE